MANGHPRITRRQLIKARTVAIIQLGNLAYWNHTHLHWDPKNWKFVGHGEADKWMDRDRREPWALPKV